jgi:release factor glutamine methyltransferase
MIGVRDATVRSALAAASDALAAAGCDTPRLDTELLLGEALGVDRAALVLDGGRSLDGEAAARFGALLERRARREPVAYILGRRAFRRIELEVDPHVLIPRPETELLVEVALELPRGARAIDVGTGSGAVALALADERPNLDVTGSDVSEAALAVARANGERLGLDVAWRCADLLAGAGDPFDAVLANLPYVADGELDGLVPEIVYFEPRAALSGGSDGLVVLRRLVAQLDGVPFVALEVGAGQAPAVRELLVGVGFGDTETRHDLAGIERVVVGRGA